MPSMRASETKVLSADYYFEPNFGDEKVNPRFFEVTCVDYPCLDLNSTEFPTFANFQPKSQLFSHIAHDCP